MHEFRMSTKFYSIFRYIYELLKWQAVAAATTTTMTTTTTTTTTKMMTMT